MKLKRAKAYKKQMNYLHLNFGFREPYQILVDEEMILEAVRTNFDLKAGFERTLQGAVKPMVTQCAIEHLYKAKDPQAISLAKTFERRRCGHRPGESTLSVFECIKDVVDAKGENKHRYAVATQKPKLRAFFRGIPAVPLIHIKRSVMVLEPMGEVTQEARRSIESKKLETGLNEQPQRADDGQKVSRTKGPKAPNPLSVKKRQRPLESDETNTAKKRRKRGKKKGSSLDDSTTKNGQVAPMQQAEN